MPDYVLIDGDKVIFLPAFGAAIVSVKPGEIKGSGPATLNSAKLCVDGDEGQVEVKGCQYVSGAFSIPGTGTLKVEALAGNQKATKTKTGGKPVLLLGQLFTAAFEVQSPAQQPPPGPGSPTPDPTTKYAGYGIFKTKNKVFKGS